MISNLSKKINNISKNWSFHQEFKFKSKKQLMKLLTNQNWQVIDLRNRESYIEHHLIHTTNIPSHIFKLDYFKTLKLNKKTLLISNDKRSNLNIYRWLKSKKFDIYILDSGYKDLRNDADFDHLTRVNLIV